jgi:hypothetical protein
MRTLVIFAIAIAFAAPAGAQSTTGMAAMQYYVGTWNCMAGPVGSPPGKATATFTMDSGLLRQSVVVPAQGQMTAPLVISIATSYDAKSGQFVQTYLDSQGGWAVSSAPPWTGNTEQWSDKATQDGKLGRGQTVRTDQNNFAFSSYPTVSATQANFQGTCSRSS